MRHIACHNDDCPNKGAPYFDFEDGPVIVVCPHCQKTMTKIPSPPQRSEGGGDA
jgi:uncharacterized Zn finger protein (UPF0148 family)